jgi:glycosyltransferase involved in cell wall biosynthesis
MIVLYNPHVDDFLATPPHFRVLRRRALKKYGFLIPGELARNGEVKVLVDATISAFIPEKYFLLLPTIIRNLVSSIEFKLWRTINDFDRRVSRIAAPTAPVDDVLLAFSYKAATGCFSRRKACLSRYRAVVFHLSHYFISSAEKAKNISGLDNVWLAGDSDISSNYYFKTFFSWYRRDFLIMPFSVANRFRDFRLFHEREHRCVATGTFHDLTQEVPVSRYTDYLSVAGLSTYHPLRKMLFDQAADLSKFVESKLTPYRQVKGLLKTNRWLMHFSITQHKYFALDIVDLYNDYQCAVVGEEHSGFPALGSFEAMACGCVLIGDPASYEGLGLIEGVHFVPHDGTVESVIKATRKVVGTDEGAWLSRNGREFVQKNFNPQAVYSRWMSNIDALKNEN